MKDRHAGGGVPVKDRYWNVIGQKREIHTHMFTHMSVYFEREILQDKYSSTETQVSRLSR